MRIARYWARAKCAADRPGGGRIEISCRAWDQNSLAAARSAAERQARALAERIVAGGDLPRASHYAYGDAPLPEPILSEIELDGERLAVVSRNAAGCTVLRARNKMKSAASRDMTESASSGLSRVLDGLIGRLRARSCALLASSAISRPSRQLHFVTRSKHRTGDVHRH